jgi:hypothetical protein
MVAACRWRWIWHSDGGWVSQKNAWAWSGIGLVRGDRETENDVPCRGKQIFSAASYVYHSSWTSSGSFGLIRCMNMIKHRPPPEERLGPSSSSTCPSTHREQPWSSPCPSSSSVLMGRAKYTQTSNDVSSSSSQFRKERGRSPR